MYKTAFSARDQHVLSFLHWAHHFFVIFSNVLEDVQNSVFARDFVIFALGANTFCDFQQRARGCTKQRFQPKISTFCHFCTGRTTFLQFSATCSRMYKTAFSARDVQNSVFSPRSARFVIFALGAPLFLIFSNVLECSMYKTAFSARDHCTFCHFCTGRTTFLQFSATCSRMYKTAFSARDQHVLSFLHWAHHFFFSPRSAFSATCSSARECTKQRFQPEISTFCHFCTGRTTFCDFQQRARVCTKQRFQINTFCHFCTGRTTFL